MDDHALIKAQAPPVELERVPLVGNQRGLGWLSDRIAGVIEGETPAWWKICFAISVTMMTVCFAAILYLMSTGVGVWGLGHPVMWGWAIVNFVWWIGIGHAGTLISAILFLLRQRWRTSINRAAEAMTIFAVMCAGIFPLIHIGRIWYGWWLFPIPNSNSIWPQFRSPLMWDVFAVSTYFTVSVLFWYMGLIPDLAVMRDRAKTKIRKFGYGLFALGWRGSNRHWSNYEKAYLILAGLSTPLVLSVHSIVSLDFSVSQLPGWHTTIFPPYFVAGAVYSGFGMVLTLLVPLRRMLHLEDIIRVRHVELMCKVTLATGSIVGYAYAMEFFIAWYSGNPYERFQFFQTRAADPFIFGPLMHIKPAPYWWAFWTMVTCNVVVPQFFWFKKVRTSMLFVFVLSILVNVGMWFERFVIVDLSLHREFLPSNWNYYSPTWVDICQYLGTFGLFFTFFLLFIRYIPLIAIAEVKGVTPQADPHHPLGGAKPGRGTLMPAPFAIMAEFETPADTLHAAEKVRETGYRQWDVFTPFPIHGMDRAMGIQNSKVGWFSFIGGCTGYLTGMLMIWFMNAYDYRIVIGGKPMFSPFYSFPPSYELTILFGSFGALLGMLFLNRLPRLHHPLLKNRRFALATHDRFYVVIESSDPRYSENETRRLLESAGSKHIELVEE